jgi:hypothetical protein
VLKQEIEKMSLNLYFEKVSGKNCLIDFPFQTPSRLTMDVMNAITLDDKLQIIEAYLKNGPRTEKEISAIIATIREFLNDPSIELTYL